MCSILFWGGKGPGTVGRDRAVLEDILHAVVVGRSALSSELLACGPSGP